MNTDDFAAHVALDVVERAGKILPLLQEFSADTDDPISELQAITLGSILLMVFDGLTDSIEQMAACFEAILPFEGVDLSDADAALRAWTDENGQLQ